MALAYSGLFLAFVLSLILLGLLYSFYKEDKAYQKSQDVWLKSQFIRMVDDKLSLGLITQEEHDKAILSTKV